jgi:hypothetical protein
MSDAGEAESRGRQFLLTALEFTVVRIVVTTSFLCLKWPVSNKPICPAERRKGNKDILASVYVSDFPRKGELEGPPRRNRKHI